MRKPTMWFPTRSDTNWAVWPQKMTGDCKFLIQQLEELCTILVAKTKELISFTVTEKLVCVFVFAYANYWFSHDAAHIFMIGLIKEESPFSALRAPRNSS